MILGLLEVNFYSLVLAIVVVHVMNGPVVYSRLEWLQDRGVTSLTLMQNRYFDLTIPFSFISGILVACEAKAIGTGTISLRVNSMVDLRELPQTKFQFDLILHVHDEREGFDEVRGLLRTTTSQVLEVRPGKPVGEPEANVEPAVGLVLDLVEDSLLLDRTELILHPHPGKLEA